MATGSGVRNETEEVGGDAKLRGRSEPPAQLDAERLEALRSRFETLARNLEPRASKAWEIGLVAEQLVGITSLAVRLGVTPADTAFEELDLAGIGRAVCLSSAAAALASSPTLCDPLLGRATASSKAPHRAVVVAHERRPIDPMDWLRAYHFAAIRRDLGAMAALAASVDSVDADPAFSGRLDLERDLYREVYRELAGQWFGDGRPAGAAAAAAARARQVLPELDEFRALRIRDLILPLVDAIDTTDKVRALADVLKAHASYWGDERRRSDPEGFVSWSALSAHAAITARGGELALPATEVLPSAVTPADRWAAGETTVAIYEAPELAARTMAEASLRVALSTGAAPHATTRIDGGRSADTYTVEAIAGERIVYRFQFKLTTPDEQGFGHGASALLDAGEWLFIAERELARARATEGEASAKHLEVGRAAADQALALLGSQDELFRDRMTSPLGRKLCDGEPHRFTREALEKLRATFDPA
ncbi:MAG: Imm49 family immunity protein [Polyangiaceae bacterium]